ncbi:unnamed protein product [Phaeothamnion confervicola]
MPSWGRETSLKAREDGWDDGWTAARPAAYNALADPNMRHYFENVNTQRHLLATGQIDREGRIIDLDRAKSKLHIIEHEFAQAELCERLRAQEEERLRERVRLKRHAALQDARREAQVARVKEDRRIRREILRATLESRGVFTRGINCSRAGWGGTLSRSASAVGTASRPNLLGANGGGREDRWRRLDTGDGVGAGEFGFSPTSSPYTPPAGMGATFSTFVTQPQPASAPLRASR